MRHVGNLLPLDRDALRFALWTTGAALVALLASAGLGIDHPWWAAMTVWLVAQPTRGLLLERILARMSGTVIGAGAGSMILIVAGGDWFATLALLTLWLALCAAGGSLARHFRTYAFVLSGYSAAIVVLFRLGAVGTVSTGGDVSGDRILCTLIGVVCSTVAAFRLPTNAGGASIQDRLDQLVERVLDHVMDGAKTTEAALADIVALERQADDVAAGSTKDREAARRARRAMGPLVELLARSPIDGLQSGRPDLRACAGVERIEQVARYAAAIHRGDMVAPLDELRLSLTGRGDAIPWRDRWAVIDGRRVTHASLRPVVALVVAAALWRVSGWHEGAMMAMAAALFASVFSSHKQGNRALGNAFIGAFIGLAAGTVYHLAIPPGQASSATVVVMITPVLLLGAYLMRRRTTSALAIDLNMAFLLAAQPLAPRAAVAEALSMSTAIIAGLAIAFLTYRYILPANVPHSAIHLCQRVRRLCTARETHTDARAAYAVKLALRATILRQLDIADPPSSLAVLIRPLAQ